MDKEYVDYHSPQDYGNHDDVRWATLTDGSTGGLLVAGDLEVGVTPYDDADRAAYPFALKRNDGWNSLHVDHAVSGVSETFHTVMPQYQVRPDREYSYSLLLRPLSEAEVSGGGQPGGPAACGPEATLSAPAPHVEPGRSTKATLTVSNPCKKAVTDVAATLRAPTGWTVTPAEANLGRVDGGHSKSVELAVARGEDTASGERPLTADVTALTAAGTPTFTSTSVTLFADPKAPHGDVAVSSLEFLSAENGWGPVERDLSNGEDKSGDGVPISIGGQKYAKGLGVHAYSDVEVYAGGTCTSFTADVGVDDEVGDAGTMVFEVYVDGTRKWTSEKLTGSGAAEKATVDITGARVVSLRAHDASDGNAHDHGDWAGATLHCAP